MRRIISLFSKTCSFKLFLILILRYNIISYREINLKNTRGIFFNVYYIVSISVEGMPMMVIMVMLMIFLSQVDGAAQQSIPRYVPM